jgi:DNA topoisomerase-1
VSTHGRTENLACARAAGLRYVRDGEPGFTREPRGKKFIYKDAKGRVVRNAKVLDRVRSLVIPPAWTDVWICAHADGHLQATGRDARGRKQYRYHPSWNTARDGGKYDRMMEFAAALPHIRKRVDADLKKPQLSREHVLATVVRLLEKTLIRIGNKEYARANNSFGLTTLRDHHVRIQGSSLTFHFRAKSGIIQTIAINDATLARFVKKCREVPGTMLFQYIDANGKRQCVDSSDVNAYLKAMTGQPFTAKNFRTWSGSVLVAKALCDVPPATSEAAFKRNMVKAVDLARERLGNTRAVCRKCYVHPAVFDAYRDGLTIANIRPAPRRTHFSAEEAAVLAMLKRRQDRTRREKVAA